MKRLVVCLLVICAGCKGSISGSDAGGGAGGGSASGGGVGGGGGGASVDAGADAGADAGIDGGADAGTDGGSFDAGPQLYGVPWTMAALSNAEIGFSHYDSPLPHRTVSIRFRASHTGALASFKQYFIFADYVQRTYCSQPPFSAGHSNDCYGANGGGVIQLDLEADNPATHEPSGQPLATAVISDPMNSDPAAPIYGANSAGNFRVVSSFDQAPTLQAGVLYHLVYTDIVQTSDPWWDYDYVSIDSMLTPTATNREPGASDDDLAVLYRDDPDGGWTTRSEAPIYELDYSDGVVQGVAWIDDFPSDAKPIAGSMQAREVFTVSGGDRVLASVTAYVGQTMTAPIGALNLSLLGEDGGTYDSCSVPVAGGGTGFAWLGCSLAARPTVRDGQTYQLVMSSAAGAGSWLVYPIEKGMGYGFDPSTCFGDGHAGYSTDDGSTWPATSAPWPVNVELDLSVYFTVAP